MSFTENIQFSDKHQIQDKSRVVLDEQERDWIDRKKCQCGSEVENIDRMGRRRTDEDKYLEERETSV